MLTSLSSPDIRLKLTRRILILLGGLLLVLASTGCVNIRSDDVADSPDPSPEVTPASDRIDAPLEPSIASIHVADDPEEVLGSAVVLSADGLLATSTDVLHGEIEVMLPDGSTHRPALVSISNALDLGLLKVPEVELIPVEFDEAELSVGSEVFATGFDASSGELGRISGEVIETLAPADDTEFPMPDNAAYTTDMNLPEGFLGGALSGDDGAFCGVIVENTSSDEEEAFRAISHGAIAGWLDHRQDRVDSLSSDAETWDQVSLPGDWTIRQPETWSLSTPTDDDDTFRAEFTPADPDVSLQLAVSVERNEYGTDPDTFVDQVFADRSSARIWTIDQLHDRAYVRASILQEGALVDVAYLLDDDYLIAILLTSGYQPESDPGQVDEARALFDAVVGSLHQE